MKSLLVRFGVILICIWLLISYGYGMGQDSTNLIPAHIGGKCGYKDKKGRMIIRPMFDECSFFIEGLAAAKIRNKWGFIDETGKMIITPKFDLVFSFSNGLAGVKIGEKWGYIDKRGKYVIDPKFDYAHTFVDGLASVKDGEKYGFININGNYVIEPRFDLAYNWWSEGLTFVKVGDKWGYIDRSGNYVIDPRFLDASPFSQGLAAVNLGSGWGYIDQKGRPLFGSTSFNRAENFTQDGLAAVKVANKWGFINKKGDIVIDPKFDSLDPDVGPMFSEGRAMVEGFISIDVSGQVISEDWILCARGKDDIHFVYYNKKNISFPSKNTVKLWSKWVELGKGYDMSLSEMDCLNKTYKFVSLTYYNKEGNVTSSHSYAPEKSELRYIVPNTLMEILFDKVCSQNRNKERR